MIRGSTYRAGFLVVVTAIGAGAACGQKRNLNRVIPILETDDAVDFGEVAAGTTRTEALTLRNTGNGDLVVADVRVVGDDAFAVDTGNRTKIEPTQSATWEVGFSPTTTGPFDATLLIESNHDEGQLVEVSLVGVGVQSCTDVDGDGYGTGCASGDDCDDGDDTVTVETTFYRDQDGDTFGDPDATQDACTVPPGYVDNGLDCDDGDATLSTATDWYADDDGDLYGDALDAVTACGQPAGYVDNDLDCDDTDPDLNPDTTWYRDFDGDLYGDPLQTQSGCVQPTNYVDNDLDCDDTDYTRYPGATWYRDGDGDTFGTPFDTVTGCAPPPGYVGNDSDCDDTNPAYHPGATFYRDADGDTYGDPAVTTTACMPTAGWVENGDDCDDGDPAIVPTLTWYRDADGDTYGAPADSRLACTQPAGYVDNDLDCDDTDAAAFPGATWYRDFDGDSFGNPAISRVQCLREAGWVENDLDCDDTDAGVGANLTWYEDADGDTFGNPAVSQQSCTPPVDWVGDDSDCDDTDPNVHPNASETTGPECSDGIDNDCDGEPDSFDSDCTFIDCGEPAYYLTTDNCNADYPANTGPQICEEYPNSTQPPGFQEQCMQVCRSSSECPAGQACYPSRRSLNLHFCAPVIGSGLVPLGGACSADDQCATALCHAGFCRDTCVRDDECGGGEICRAEVRNHAYIGNDISTGVCQPINPALLPVGSTCTSRAQCQSGICAQSSATGPHLCRASCGSDGDCGFERCAGALYDMDPTVGYGHRACSEASGTATQAVGDSCYSALLGGWYDQGCTSLFCDGTYCPSGDPLDATNCPIEPYCGGLCDKDDDCPLLFPGAYNLRMRCLITSSNLIAPLIGGYCAPFFCETTADCEAGRTCFIFNPVPKQWAWLAAGVCQ